ncbi:concanavalin A-like lectin/glucanase domain-containing protein [Phyllosticta citriasiana]|uniref:concanavalin A-like lectin/glucanase domain-containing protein n=1 Tax=Phyllosticta citriasiana TaxID=595635 RepID=UPI0030FDCB8D
MQRHLFQLAALLGLATLPTLSTAHQLNPPCNPTPPQASPCPVMPGLNDPRRVTYDFSQKPTNNNNKHGGGSGGVKAWNALSDESGSIVWTGTPDGAEFTLARRGDRPTMELDSYIWYGRVDVEMKAIKGKGAISAITLLSDTGDEINWQMYGDELAFPKINYAGQGVAGTRRDVSAPSISTWDNEPIFHKYSIEWSEDRIAWSLDDVEVRGMTAKDTAGGPAYPHTPSRVRIGAMASGNVNVTALDEPWKMYVRKVMVKNDYHSKYYEFVDRSGWAGNMETLGEHRDGDDPRNKPGDKKKKKKKQNINGRPFEVHKIDSVEEQEDPKHKHKIGHKPSAVQNLLPTGIHEFDSPSQLSRPNHGGHTKAPLSLAAGLAVQSGVLLLTLGASLIFMF